MHVENGKNAKQEILPPTENIAPQTLRRESRL